MYEINFKDQLASGSDALLSHPSHTDTYPNSVTAVNLQHILPHLTQTRASPTVNRKLQIGHLVIHEYSQG